MSPSEAPDMAEARASADGEVLALGYGDDGVEGQGWYLAGADEGLELEPPVRVGRSMGAERAGQPGATVEDLAAAAAPSALDVQAFNRVLVCPACAKKCAVSMEQCNGCGASLAGVPESKSGNLFVGFALGAELAPFGELQISVRARREHAGPARTDRRTHAADAARKRRGPGV